MGVGSNCNMVECTFEYWIVDRGARFLHEHRVRLMSECRGVVEVFLYIFGDAQAVCIGAVCLYGLGWE